VGHSQAAKAENHTRILEIAAAMFRELGIDGVGVIDLMKAAGLTHGGFYRHFDSREALVAEGVECALADGGQRVANVLSDNRKAPFAAIVDAYLAVAHRDSLAAGCAVAALASDVARSNKRARTAYTQQVRAYLELIGGTLPRANRKTARRQAVFTLSALVGAVSLARAINDERLSLEILKLTADALKAQAE
jgi:TetR/AcrR family transcriptional regulator, transcriptional repressor for nem operon